VAEIKFENALKKLEKIVEELEKGDLPLEDSLARYEYVIKL
jgi:exodeoxyribonuclease VII small subunit